MRHGAAALGVSLLMVSLMIASLLLFPIRPFEPIQGATLIETARLCPAPPTPCTPDTASARPVPLTWHVAPEGAGTWLEQDQSGIHSVRFLLLFDRVGGANDATALYLPRFSDAIQIEVNDVTLTKGRDTKGNLFHLGHRPFFTTVPNPLLQPTDNQLVITLSGYSFQSLSLSPVYAGEVSTLDLTFQIQMIFRAGMARVNFALGVLAGTAFLLFGLTQRRDPAFLWLAAASLAGAALCYYWIYPNFTANPRKWVTLWTMAAALQVWFTLNFIVGYVGARLVGLRLASGCLVLAGTGCMLWITETLIRPAMMLTQLSILALSLSILFVLVFYRARLRLVNFAVLFALYSMAIALSVTEWVAHYLLPDSEPVVTSPFIPVVVVCSLLWIIFYQLAQSLSQYEDLTRSLQTTIDERTAELHQSYDRLAVQTQQQTIDDERQRILLDLHDGIGGQLVNALAYMATQPDQDVVLQTALEDALRDMGLIIDSLEAGDSIATQLGLLRGRLESLLQKHTIELVWQITDDPQLPDGGPSQNLALLRIVQEAITNAIKHADARSITVRTTARSISVVDDGHGFTLPDPDQPTGPNTGSGSGIGLAGMQRRAETVGVDLEIASTASGSSVTLSW